MNSEKRPESAMESAKKDALSRVEPGQGGRGGESRRTNITPSASANQEIHISSPASVQRARILARLRIGPATTLQLRNELHVMHPGGRVHELRRLGFNILSRRQPSGMAEYFLVGREAGR